MFLDLGNQIEIRTDKDNVAETEPEQAVGEEIGVDLELIPDRIQSAEGEQEVYVRPVLKGRVRKTLSWAAQRRNNFRGTSTRSSEMDSYTAQVVPKSCLRTTTN